jgi:predicted CoA-substrate-specific enzyme activase
MNKGNILAGVDAGHVNTKAVIIRGEEILGYCTVPTGFDVVAAAQSALNDASDRAGIPRGELRGIVATGIFRDRVKVPPLNVTTTVPDYMADAKGALFLNENSRTVIDIGGNIHKAIRYDQNGNLQDVIQNDKCADGMGIFYTTIAKAMGLSEREISELALKSTKKLSVAIQCALSAESDAIDLMCQGADIADVADAISRFIVERVADMCTTMNLSKEIVVAGGLAKSRAIIKHLASLIEQDLYELKLPEYVGAIGAAISEEAPRFRTGLLPRKKPLAIHPRSSEGGILAFSRDGGGK